jgi:AcrR family transcriptional regulator
VARDREILDAAAALFYEKGFHGVGLNEIAQRVGISGPAIYRHFATKQEMLATLYHEAFDELLAGVGVATEDPRADLDQLMRSHVEFALKRRELTNVYSRETTAIGDVDRRQFNRRARQYSSHWEATLARVYPEAAPEIIAGVTQAAIAVINSIAYWPPEALALPDLAGFLRRMATEGLRMLEPAAAGAKVA